MSMKSVTGNSSHSRQRRAAVVLAVVAAIATLPATAMAASWGPRYSYYNGIARVSGNGSMTRLANGSRSYVRACDQHNDGWGVHGYTRWTDLGNSNNRDTRYTPTVGGCADATWTMGWWNFNGFWVTAAACAQAGWPVPDSCTSPVSEAHRP